MVDQIRGINNASTQRGMDNMYTSAVQFSDLAGDSIFGEMSGFDAPMGAYSGGFDSGFGGFGGFGGGFGGGFYGPTEADMKLRNSMTTEQWTAHQMKQQAELENTSLRLDAERAQQESSARFKAAAPDNNISRKLGLLNHSINNNDQDKISKLYEELTEAVVTKFHATHYEASEDEIKAEVEKLYKEQTGNILIEDIKEKGSSSFVKGLKEGFGCGLGYLMGDEHSAEDNISKITGEEPSKAETISRWTGRIISGTASLILAPLAIVGCVFGGGKLLAKGMGESIGAAKKLLFGSKAAKAAI